MIKETERLKELKLKSLSEKYRKKDREKEGKKIVANQKKGSYSSRLQQAGLPFNSSTWITAISGTSLIILVVFSNAIGIIVGACLSLCWLYYFLSMYPTARSQKRRREVVPKLPGFIDTLGASLGAGYNMEVALEHAAVSLPNGVLRTEFMKVVRMMQGTMTVDEGLDYLVGRIAGQEIIALTITLRLFHDMGGRALTPFQRLGFKIREQQSVLERASRDLVGTKQAFYVIFCLAITAPLFLLVQDPEYLKAAFNHSWIGYVMQGSIVVQALCLMVFKRFTTLQV